jgi:hypothetical protein
MENFEKQIDDLMSSLSKDLEIAETKFKKGIEENEMIKKNYLNCKVQFAAIIFLQKCIKQRTRINPKNIQN